MARDGSSVKVRSPQVAKTGVTAITEQNNNTPNQATVGEVVTYRYSVVVPAGPRSTRAAWSTPCRPASCRRRHRPPCSSTPTPPSPPRPRRRPGRCSTPRPEPLSFGPVYANDTGTDQRFEVRVTARVTTAAVTATQNAVDAHQHGAVREPGSARRRPAGTGHRGLRRQPAPAAPHPHEGHRPDDTGRGRNPGDVHPHRWERQHQRRSTNRPPLHDAFLVDCLPAGLVFEAYGSDPGTTPVGGNGSNGCPQGRPGWSWSLGDVAAGTPLIRTYTARLPLDAVGGDAYTNTAQPAAARSTTARPTRSAPTTRSSAATRRPRPRPSRSPAPCWRSRYAPTARRSASGSPGGWRPARSRTPRSSRPRSSTASPPVSRTSARVGRVPHPHRPGQAAAGDRNPPDPVPQADGSTLYGWTVGDSSSAPTARAARHLQRSDRRRGRSTSQAGRSSTPPRPRGTSRRANPDRGRLRVRPQERADSATATVLEPRLTVPRGSATPPPSPPSVSGTSSRSGTRSAPP